MAGGAGVSGRILVRDEGLNQMAREMMDELRVEAERVMQDAQDVGLKAIQMELSKSGDGPAPKGEAPRLRSGELLLSWEKGKVRWLKRFGRDELHGILESDHPAAGALEWGAPRLGIEAHPYVRPAFARIEGQIERMFTGGG